MKDPLYEDYRINEDYGIENLDLMCGEQYSRMLQNIIMSEDFDHIKYIRSIYSEIKNNLDKKYFDESFAAFVKSLIREKVVEDIRDGKLNEVKLSDIAADYQKSSLNSYHKIDVNSLLPEFNRREFDYLIEKYYFLQDSSALSKRYESTDINKIERKIRRVFNSSENAEIVHQLRFISPSFRSQIEKTEDIINMEHEPFGKTVQKLEVSINGWSFAICAVIFIIVMIIIYIETFM